MSDWVTLLGDLFIAGVIYYEVEEHRASTFLADVQGAEFYRDRARVYDTYAHLSASNLKERGEAFRKERWANKSLRESCDLQWTYFNRLRYMLRHTLVHRHLLARWFPQVIVSFWVMTAVYIRERQRLRPTGITSYGVIAVTESLQELKRHGFKTLTIYSDDGQARVEISVDELEQMLADVDAPFR